MTRATNSNILSFKTIRKANQRMKPGGPISRRYVARYCSEFAILYCGARLAIEVVLLTA
jgi:hypothetical protein